MTKINSTFSLLIAALLGISALAPTADAFEGGHGSGNGGDPNELAEFTGRGGVRLASWYEVKMDLIRGFRIQTVNPYGITLNPDLLAFKALSSLLKTKLEFKNEPIFVDGVLRACKNFIDSANQGRIQCDPKTYADTMKNYTSEEQYKFIAHEYFGPAGLEPNTYGSSDYPHSSKISKSLKEIVVKRWCVGCKGSLSTTLAYLEKKDAEKLYKRLNVKPVDQDDIINKTLKLDGLLISCDYWLLAKAYTCTVSKL